MAYSIFVDQHGHAMQHLYICTFSELWGVLNNAGIIGPLGPLEFLTRKSFCDLFEVNLFGTVDVTKTFLPLLKESRGRIINTSSAIACTPTPGILPYVASKCAIRGFTNVLR